MKAGEDGSGVSCSGDGEGVRSCLGGVTSWCCSTGPGNGGGGKRGRGRTPSDSEANLGGSAPESAAARLVLALGSTAGGRVVVREASVPGSSDDGDVAIPMAAKREALPVCNASDGDAIAVWCRASISASEKSSDAAKGGGGVAG